jgi:hypothetical protein
MIQMQERMASAITGAWMLGSAYCLGSAELNRVRRNPGTLRRI